MGIASWRIVRFSWWSSLNRRGYLWQINYYNYGKHSTKRMHLMIIQLFLIIQRELLKMPRISNVLLDYVVDGDLQTTMECVSYSTSIREIVTVGYMIEEHKENEKALTAGTVSAMGQYLKIFNLILTRTVLIGKVVNILNRVNRLRNAVETKRQELIQLFKDMGHTQLPCGTPISSLTLTELQEIYRRGIRK